MSPNYFPISEWIRHGILNINILIPVLKHFHLQVLRFSRLFGPGRASSLPQIWRGVKRRKKRRRTDSASSDIHPNVQIKTEAEPCSDDEEKLLR